MESEIFDFLRHIRPRMAATTYARKLWQIRAFGRWLAAENKRYAEVKRPDVERFLLSMDCTHGFRQALCGVIREFYEFLKIQHPYPCPFENPAAGIEFMPDKSRRLPKVPSQAAVDAIFARLYEQNGNLWIRDRLMAELAYGSGLRRAELARLNIEDIDLEAATVHVIGKGDKARIVPLTSRAIAAVREYLCRRHASRGPLLLSYAGRRLGKTGVYEIMRHRVGIRPHLLRHACATHMLKNGCAVRVIQELLGHERIDTTYLYTAVDRESLRDIIAKTHPGKTITK
jgi:site-specific recombinase XerD